jgi:hypothetical protein
MSRFHNAPDKRALSVTVLRAVCSADVRAEAPTDFGEKTDRHRQGCVQKPCSRSSLWADCMRCCNSHGVRHPNCSLGWLGVLATARHEPGSTEDLGCAGPDQTPVCCKIVQRMRRGRDGDDHGPCLAQRNLAVPAGILFSGLTGKPRDECPRHNRPEPAIYVRRARAASPDCRTARRAAHANRHFSGHSNPRDRGRLAVYRPAAESDGGRITSPFQRALTTTVNDIEHIVANSYNGFGIIKIFFQPSVDIRVANAQVTAISQTLIKQMPPGTTPPLILNYNASTVPIILCPAKA